MFSLFHSSKKNRLYSVKYDFSTSEKNKAVHGRSAFIFADPAVFINADPDPA